MKTILKLKEVNQHDIDGDVSNTGVWRQSDENQPGVSREQV